LARRLRIDVPGVPQHVIQRGNNRSVCFYDDGDYVAYLEFLGRAIHKAGCSLHAYVLMTNHVHLLVTGHHVGSVGVMMQSLGRCYVRFINHQYRRTGGLWEGRYKSCLINSDRYLLTCYRYIEMNPVRSRMVHAPGHYAWSSYRHHVDERPDPLIEDHDLFLMLGNSPSVRAVRYRELFREPLDEMNVDRIRQNTNKGTVLGSTRLLKPGSE
jgi:putative transposase